MSYPKGRSFGEHSPRSREKKLKTITDKHRLTIATKVSRNSSEEKIVQNYGGDFSTFGQLAQQSVLHTLSLRTKYEP